MVLWHEAYTHQLVWVSVTALGFFQRMKARSGCSPIGVSLSNNYLFLVAVSGSCSCVYFELNGEMVRVLSPCWWYSCHLHYVPLTTSGLRLVVWGVGGVLPRWLPGFASCHSGDVITVTHSLQLSMDYNCWVYMHFLQFTWPALYMALQAAN